jgi:hypothetical protein
VTASNWFYAIPYRETLENNASTPDIVVGTSSDATAYIELRAMQYTTGTTSTNLTRKDLLIALERFKRFIINGGTTGNGTDLPAG